MAYTKEPKKKGGRPPKLDHEKRTQKVAFCVTENDLDGIKYRAQMAGMRRADYCRQMALNGEVRAALTDEDRDRCRAVAGMKNNLNQIARQVNSYGSSAYRKLESKLMAAFNEILQLFYKANGAPK